MCLQFRRKHGDNFPQLNGDGMSHALSGRRPKWLVLSVPVRFVMRNTFLVCYDICDDKRLKKVFKTMRDFGDHLQYSVFECQFTPTDLARCRHVLSELINQREDQVIFVDLGPTEGRGERVISAIGQAYSKVDAPCYVV
jgi:CRISPR-associated protein Cas2